ncbi:venom dipeptidyl peptidase 4-like [Diaphorina citri]|uniref:Venom dipeptidyl peptidase 4 n=2 Tax=Diaphorina citri TaxID=121845 RepID=A0A3Q0IXL3_DIACI|nr:venom dipeptidyl peptidase 4-like [Diaphorina citri]
MNTVQSSHGGHGPVNKKGDALEELVSIAPNERNWRGICIALLVIVGVLSLIVFFIVLLSPPFSGLRSPGSKFSVEHITGNHFYAAPFNGTWRQLNAVEFSISSDIKYVILATDVKREIFKSEKCIWFSKDGKHLVYASFNDTNVGVMRYPVYSGKVQYPEIQSVSYPKPNTPNPEVSVWLVSLENLSQNSISPRPVPLPRTMLGDGEPYLVGVAFARKRFAVIWLNRKHSEFSISICDTNKGDCIDSYSEKIASRGWVSPHSNIVFAEDELTYLTLLPIMDGTSQFFHICQINITTRTFTPLTHGQFTVTKILSWDQTNHYIYFEALPERRPSQRHVYKIHDNLNISAGIPECLTCPGLSHNVNYTSCMNLSKIENEVMNSTNVTLYQWDSWPVKTNCCLFVRAHFSLPTPFPKYYVVECLEDFDELNEPIDDQDLAFFRVIESEKVRRKDMDTVSNQRINFLNNYTKLANRYRRMAAPHVKIFEVESEFGFLSQVKLLIPSNFRDYDDLVFPLLLYVAGKPGTQSVTQEWSVNWATYLVSNRNFIVAIVDSRGSFGQGVDMESQIQYKLGQFDVEDQLTILKYIKDLEFIDKTRIGIWGQGYGGFLTAMMMSRDSTLLKCGISLSPITNWAHYNSVWTEKFMGTPNVTDNFLGYEESDLSKHVAGLKDKNILFIHGSADVSVPYQHSMILTRALTNANIIYRHQTYTDEGFSFQGVKTHLYETIEAFWEECFGPMDIEEWDEGLSFLTFAQ